MTIRWRVVTCHETLSVHWNAVAFVVVVVVVVVAVAVAVAIVAEASCNDGSCNCRGDVNSSHATFLFSLCLNLC